MGIKLWECEKLDLKSIKTLWYIDHGSYYTWEQLRGYFKNKNWKELKY